MVSARAGDAAPGASAGAAVVDGVLLWWCVCVGCACADGKVSVRLGLIMENVPFARRGITRLLGVSCICEAT